MPHFGGLRLDFEGCCVVRLGAHFEGKLPPDTEGRLIGQQVQHLLEFQDTQCVVVHFRKGTSTIARIRASWPSPVSFSIDSP